MFSSIATITSEAWTNKSPKNVNTYLHTYLLSSKTMRVPISPIARKGEVPKPWEGPSHGFGTSPTENAERIPISPYFP